MGKWDRSRTGPITPFFFRTASVRRDSSIVGDAGRPHGVIADSRLDARPVRMTVYQPVGILLRHAVRCAGRAPGRAE
jgi:hypothetical protein